MKILPLKRMALLTAAIVSIGFISCGGDDVNDDKKNNIPIDNPTNPDNGGGSGSGSSNGNGSSNDSVFLVQTGNTSDITNSSATLSGSFTTTNGQPDAIGFLIGTSYNLTETNCDRNLTIFDIYSPFSATVTDLHSQTTYYYRAYVKKSNSYYFGETKSFDTNGGNSNNGNSSVAKGSGTLTDPYNVAAIIEVASRLKAGEIDATDYYFKGMISQITNDFRSESTDSTATFYISDIGGTAEFLCNHVKYHHNEGFWAGAKNITIGDEVMICGKITNDCTSSGRAYVYSLNGNTGTTEAIEYILGGRTFHTVLVEGGPMKPFYIMQTEIPINADITINNKVLRYADTNSQNGLDQVEFISYLLKLRNMTGYRIRLPTKEEWQYAAQGGNQSKGYTYSGSNTIDDVAWYSGNSNGQVHDVAQKQPNELGLYDMSGNYAEIINNTNKESYVDGDECGGSWKNTASDCTIKSWKKQETGKMPSGVMHERRFDGSYVTFRFVYTKWY